MKGRLKFQTSRATLILIVLIGLFSMQCLAQKPIENAPKRRSFTVDLAGPPVFFLNAEGKKTWRYVLGYTHSCFKKKGISISHSIELLKYQEHFFGWWYYQYPFSPLNPTWEGGRLDHQQLSYITGVAFEQGIGKGKWRVFLEPRLALGVRWGRKMRDHVDAGRDYAVKENAISPRLRLGITVDASKALRVDFAGECLLQRYMGQEVSRLRLMPVLNLGVKI